MADFVKKIKPFFRDKRGEMSHLLEGDKSFTSAVLITSKKGAIRANHYHKKDTHYCYMINGSMEYTYKNMLKKNSKKRSIIISQGEIVITPPNMMHAMRFLENSTFIALTTESRNPREYELDTVRVKLVE